MFVTNELQNYSTDFKNSFTIRMLYIIIKTGIPTKTSIMSHF